MRQTTLINLALCFPGLTTQERTALGKASIQHTMQAIMESGAVWLWPKHKTLGLIRSVQGLDLLQQAREEGRGVIVMSPHIGNWEILGLYLNDCGVGQTYQLYQAPVNPKLDALLFSARSRSGAKMVATDNRGVAELLRALKGGGIVGILPDQVPAEAGGEYASFYGKPALTMTLLAKLQQKTGARVVVGFAERIKNGFAISFSEPDPEIYSEHMPKALEGMNRSIEALISKTPVQYQWVYKRFRKLPAGTPKVYS